MKEKQVRRSKRRDGVSAVKGSKQRQAEAVEVFANIYGLLEEYGPAWYSSSLSRKLRAALKTFGR